MNEETSVEVNSSMPHGSRPVHITFDRLIVDDSSLQKKFDNEQMADWVNLLAPWQVIAHHTFRWEASIWSAQRVYERFMNRELAHISYFYALEENPGRDGYHVHALWADCKDVFRKEVWAAWFKRYGRARIELVRNFGDVSSYCSKYVTKKGAWWNVKLQWHRKQKLNDSKFELRDDHFGNFEDELRVVIASLGGQVQAMPGVEPGQPASLRILPPVQGADYLRDTI